MYSKPIIDRLLENLGERIGTGLSELLGCSITTTPVRWQLTTKQDFFLHCRKKQVMTDMALSGSKEGTLYIFCHLKDAILLGGTLIMLPPGELEKKVAKEEFAEDEADAYNEIGNIVSGELNAAFEEGFPDKLHFRKLGQQVVVPGKVDPDSAEPIPAADYFQLSYVLGMDGQDLQSLDLLFPPACFGVEPRIEVEPEVVAEPVSVEPPPLAQPPRAEPAVPPEEPPKAVEPPRPRVLIVGENQEAMAMLTAQAETAGLQSLLLPFQGDFQSARKPDQPLQGILLVMDESKEQGLAAIIKARSTFGEVLPLIAVGASWTKSQVLQAARYGVRDILLLPATHEEIAALLQRHFLADR
ncbi:hypothetical protein [Desulfuromonas sp. CSMB_57]|uniref:hypothetical protein n=1 Tax=Desulfuromonas sp. CSMB_57 TaxID=2807629 RepID=UPI001CD5CB01|nr:hypothetical protein [Desulfuromonas sp. CSMB_57]